MQKSKAGDQEVKIDRRRKDRREEEVAKAEAKLETSSQRKSETGKDASVDRGKPEKEFKPARRTQQRRRQIDPTTCERDYNGEEIVFMQALDAYKRSSGRMFPTCSEILEVIRDLGYVKLSEEEQQLIASIEEVEAELVEASEFGAAEELELSDEAIEA